VGAHPDDVKAGVEGRSPVLARCWNGDGNTDAQA
jgi:hypothetical protein